MMKEHSTANAYVGGGTEAADDIQMRTVCSIARIDASGFHFPFVGQKFGTEVPGERKQWAIVFEFHTPSVEDLRNISHRGSVNSK